MAPGFAMQALLIMMFILPLLAFWVWMFTDMRGNRDLPDTVKSNWVRMFILLNVFGASLYFVNVYRERRYRRGARPRPDNTV